VSTCRWRKRIDLLKKNRVNLLKRNRAEQLKRSKMTCRTEAR
jgi:hypothetical protein